MNLLFISFQEFFIMVPLFGTFIYTIYHAIKNPVLQDSERALWIVLLLITNLLGMLAYWAFGKSGRGKLGI
ncbi:MULTISPECIES: PLDc N-terminal domain-containing protein [Sphingobacterium]|uniref:PLDc N-terminal domain-containing protein n=1 Tax=Sphingobacterium TaxID=28453 RepID=UPI0013DBF82E|nr:MULTISPECIES: PLDc N-terminal domain-containing protein [unclassified Sphingobacterium]